MRRYPNLDLLRLFAALEVFAIHVYNNHRHLFTPYVQPVPLFVCLSAFLIPGSFERSGGWREFARRRALRVVPAFVLSILLVVALRGASSLGPTLLCYATLGMLGIKTANGPLWSLSVEEVLYTIHGLKRCLRLWRWPVALALFAVCVAIPVTTHNPFITRITEAGAAFFLGNIAYMFRKQLEQISWPVFLAFGLMFWSLPHVHNIGTLGWQIASPLLCLCVVLFAWRLPQLKWRFPDVSYGLYIYHRPILTAFALRLGGDFAAAPYALVTSFALALLSWYLVEKPILKLKDRPWQLPKKSPKPAIVEVPA